MTLVSVIGRVTYLISDIGSSKKLAYHISQTLVVLIGMFGMFGQVLLIV